MNNRSCFAHNKVNKLIYHTIKIFSSYLWSLIQILIATVLFQVIGILKENEETMHYQVPGDTDVHRTRNTATLPVHMTMFASPLSERLASFLV